MREIISISFRAFGWSPPVIGHLPLILNKDGTKLSKRQGDVHIEHYRASGYFPEAVLNFVTDIGGGFEGRDSRLVLPVEELIKKVREFWNFFLFILQRKEKELMEKVKEPLSAQPLHIVLHTDMNIFSCLSLRLP